MTAHIATCLSDIVSWETLANTVSGRRRIPLRHVGSAASLELTS
jgi:hypothetical protein